MVRALTREDRIVTAAVYVTLSLIFLFVAYPLYFVVIASVSDPLLVSTGQVWAFPRGLTVDGYERSTCSAVWSSFWPRLPEARNTKACSY